MIIIIDNDNILSITGDENMNARVIERIEAEEKCQCNCPAKASTYVPFKYEEKKESSAGAWLGFGIIVFGVIAFILCAALLNPGPYRYYRRYYYY